MKTGAIPAVGGLVALQLAAALLVPSTSRGGVKEGEVVPDATLPTLDGKKEGLMGKAPVSVFVFIRPGQEHSKATLEALAKAQKELTGKPVYWSAVVSDRYPAADVAAEVKATGFAGPVLVDAGDSLYGALGIAMQPIIGVVDKGHALLFYQAFTKINYADVIKVRVRFALGEIDKDAMMKVVEPPAAVQGGAAQVVKRYVKLGERLYRAKDYPKAADTAKRCLETDANAPVCHGLLGLVLAGQGQCDEAKKSIARALELEPKDALAAEAKAACP